ncbi:IclR family transcriptional regulator [Pseudarthrobacter oxydans]|uniref:IclR family transcriptional regulator n=1 Tax=Pseudarthrobacter oxydans TaxID=1671 RepID=UPI0034251CD9
MTTITDPPRVEAVHRALVLLKLMSESGSISVTEAAQALNVNPSTAQRLLATLVGDGFARQGDQRRYEPGPELLRPGASRASSSTRAQARPFLERLYGQVGETVHLVTLIGAEAHHIDGIEASQHAIRFGLRLGVRLPAHQTSAGKAMLAELSDEDLAFRIRVATTRTLSPIPEPDWEKLGRDLELARQQGLATNFEESEDGVAAFGVSLGVVAGERAGLSIAMPISRYRTSDFERFATPLLRAASAFRRRDH